MKNWGMKGVYWGAGFGEEPAAAAGSTAGTGAVAGVEGAGPGVGAALEAGVAAEVGAGLPGGASALDTAAETPSWEAYGTALTSDSGRALCVPDTMTRSPSFSPLGTIQSWPLVVSAVTRF
jgi:hypothetical protein